MLKVENLHLAFGHGTVNEKHVLNGINLELTEGEFVTIIGSNGAGKSTMLNCIAGDYIPDSGKVYIDGQDVTKFPNYKRAMLVGRVFQDPLKGTAFDMTIEENMALAFMKGKSKNLKKCIAAKDTEYFKEQLKQLDLGLEDRLKQKVRFLSGGQRQAMTTLMAVMVSPKLLLLDEHTAALDPAIAATVLKLTNDLVKKYNLSTLMVTHNMKHALEFGTRTIMMDKGRIILDIKGEERAGMTKQKLIELFTQKSGSEFVTDSVLLG
ncbi:MAG: ATP-binding cassette domain-containing protein [Bacillota bacterium]|nr:ATP-binding cassette domain-containing protein [Bacillota bacterium]